MPITTIVLIFIGLAILALVWWGVSRLTIPEPIKTVVLVIFGLVVLAVIWNWVANGGLQHAFK